MQEPIIAAIRVVLGVVHPDNTCNVIDGPVSSSYFSWFSCSSRSLSHKRVSLSLQPSNLSMRDPHLCPTVNRSLQLKHKFWALLRCISSHESRLIGLAGVGCAAWLPGGRARGARTDVTGLINLLWQVH
jgi:hypothetical protein